MYISFTHQLYLVFLFIIPILIFLHFYSLRNLGGNSLKFANFEAIARVKGIDLYSKKLFALFFNVFFVLFLVLALSGLTLHKQMDVSSFSFVIAIDSSQSMTAIDLEPNRISAAKEAAIDFVNALPYESMVGVLSFSGESKIEQELTSNKQEIKKSIENIQVSSVGGTDINEAIKNSIKMLRKDKNKAVILLSDGQINVGNLDDIIDYANEEAAIIHTIGIGTVEGGEVSFGLSKLDEDSLKSLAYNTGGEFFNVKNSETLKSSFKGLITTTSRLVAINLSFYLLMIVIALFVLKQYLVSFNKIIF